MVKTYYPLCVKKHRAIDIKKVSSDPLCVRIILFLIRLTVVTLLTLILLKCYSTNHQKELKAFLIL